MLVKKWKGSRYKKWHISMGQFEQLYKPSTQDELHTMMDDLAISMRPKRNVRDARTCALCGVASDMEADGPGRCVDDTIVTHGQIFII